MKTIVAAACLVALAGIMLLMVVGPQAEAEAPAVVALSELPQAGNPPASGRAEAYRKLYQLRMARIADLEKYAGAGAFPQNYSAVEFTPVFVDEFGTACAVGHLMRCSGANALVDQIAAENSLVKLHEISDGPAVEWMLNSGLTKEECELIQPSYDRWKPGYDGRAPGEGPEPQVDVHEIAARFIRDHLEATARLLRKNTPVSLGVALRRLGGESELVEPSAAVTRIFRNDEAAPLLARVSTLDSSGELESIGNWHEVAPGTSFTIGTHAAGALLETRAMPRS